MSASLVGSEMCIRDSAKPPPPKLQASGTKAPPPEWKASSPASTVSEWVQPSTTGMGTTVSSPIFTPQPTQAPE
eukprot:866866-Alexandrium_andersonii.AAC.1